MSIAPSQVVPSPVAPSEGALEAPLDGAVRHRARLVEVDRRAERRRRRRRTRLLAVISVVLVAGSLVAVAAGQATVATRQVRLDGVEQALAKALTRNDDLHVARAEAEAPARIVELAEHRFGMVEPTSLTYLAPVDPGRTLLAAGQVR